MEINNRTNFEKEFLKRFGEISMTTLSKIKDSRVRIDLGEGLEGNSRVQQALNRAMEILDYCFTGKDLWLRIILWEIDALEALKIKEENFDEVDFKLEWKEDDYDVLCLYYKEYSFSVVSSIVISILNYEMALEPSANITCYFVDFSGSTVVNIYDERGCDIHTPNKNLMNNLHYNFKKWENKSVR